jgi:hypothetical protein
MLIMFSNKICLIMQLCYKNQKNKALQLPFLPFLIGTPRLNVRATCIIV